MGLAERTASEDADESRGRMDSARIRDTAFFISKALLPRTFARDDIELIATIVIRAQESRLSLTPAYVTAELLSRGRSQHKAQEIVSALFK